MTALAAVGLLLWLDRRDADLESVGFASGYVLMSGVLFLASYNLRKKLAALPLGNSSTWLQLHIYVGWFVIAAFGMHVSWRIPDGILESVLFGLFLFTAGSGVYGLMLSQAVPLRLSRLREEVIYERIPTLRLQVQQHAQDLITKLLQTTDAPALADFYSQSLIPYFVRRRGTAYYLRPSSRLRNRLQSELSLLERYLPHEQQTVQRQLSRLIDRRDDLDFHEAQQGRLKYWLFFHIAATYTLVLLSLVHAVVVHAFWGGAL